MAYENITINVQSSIRIETSVGVLYFDPIEISEKTADADVIFVTHDHFDHFSPESVANISKDGTILVVPEKMYKKAVSETVVPEQNIMSVSAGVTYTAGNVAFETVRAYNIIKPFHPKSAGWCGYIVTADNVRYYIAGDTDPNPDNKKVKCDVALVPVGGTYTMDAKTAAEFVNTIGPKTAIPTHYGKLVGKPQDGKIFAEKLEKCIEVIMKL